MRALRIGFLLVLTALAGCGSTPADPGTDAGRDAARPDSSTTPDTGVDAFVVVTPDTGVDAAIDGGHDAGPCTSTMPHCNTCTTQATDPFNACSSAVTNCIAFDNATRVPGWPDAIPTP